MKDFNMKSSFDIGIYNSNEWNKYKEEFCIKEALSLIKKIMNMVPTKTGFKIYFYTNYEY